MREGASKCGIVKGTEQSGILDVPYQVYIFLYKICILSDEFRAFSAIRDISSPAIYGEGENDQCLYDSINSRFGEL